MPPGRAINYYALLHPLCGCDQLIATTDDNQLYLHCRQDDDVCCRTTRALSDSCQPLDCMAANRLKLNAGSRHSAAVLGNNGPSLKLIQDTVAPSDRVRILGVPFPLT